MRLEGRLFGSTLTAWGVPAGVALADGAHIGHPVVLLECAQSVSDIEGCLGWAGHLSSARLLAGRGRHAVCGCCVCLPVADGH